MPANGDWSLYFLRHARCPRARPEHRCGDENDLRRVRSLWLSACCRRTTPSWHCRERQENPPAHARAGVESKAAEAFCRDDGQRSQLPDLPQSREEHENGWPEPAVGSRHHLCHNRDRLCVLGCDPRCLVPSSRRVRYQPLDRCTARCCCTQGRHQRPQSTKGLRPSFRPWIAICLRRLSRRLAKAWSHRLHGPARKTLRQSNGRAIHEDTEGRSRVSDGIRNLRGRHSRPSPLHRRGVQHPQTPLRARLYEPRALRGSPPPATCQKRRLKLSTPRGEAAQTRLLAYRYFLPVAREAWNAESNVGCFCCS